ncbi:MAG: DUF1428 domain-containing protein [Pseudomonadota bacterium]|nr:DUF1428 domain-containing protein [Pseudomonadota bacterium]
MNYVDGFIVAVPNGNRDSYRAMAAKAWLLFKEFGATRQVECWGDDVPVGKTTDFQRAVKAEAGETVVFSWIEYPSKEIRDAAGAKMRSDPRMKEFMENMPFDGKRMIYGGFVPLLDERG